MKTKETPKWIRPWNVEKFDDLANRDERFFAILTKGLLAWLNDNILLYNKSIPHFIFNTGSSYLYIENNGYEYKMNETSGEDAIYMQMPRCVVVPGSISVPQDELTSNFAHCQYERLENGIYKGFNAEFKRMPIDWEFTLTYLFSNYNESIIVVEELINKIIFQKYFNVTYLGQIVKCSIELGGDFNIEMNKIDMTNPDVNQKTINLAIKVCASYPVIDERSEIANNLFMSGNKQELNTLGDGQTRVTMRVLTYVSKHGIVPTEKRVEQGYQLKDNDLPELAQEGYQFLGWDKQAGFVVKSDTIITANWK